MDNSNTSEQKSKVIQQLEEALGIKPQDDTDSNQVVEIDITKDLSHIDDYEFTRKTQKELYKMGFSSLSELTDLARETSDVKYFQVLALLLKSMKDVSSGVIEAAKTKSEIELNKSKIGIQKENVINGSLSQTNNTIFVGSTNDLSKFIEESGANLDNIEDVILENANK